MFLRRHSKPHEGIVGIGSRNPDQVFGSSGLAQGKNFLMNKFSSLNQKVKQTKSTVNISNFKPLGKLGNFPKPDMKVNFLKPNMKVNLWKSDSSLETTDSNPGAAGLKDHSDMSDLELSDSDSCHSDEQPHSGSLENVDYVLPSCGIVASRPRLSSRSQSISSVELTIPSAIRITTCDGQMVEQGVAAEDEQSPELALEAEEDILIDLGSSMDAYCHQFVHDAQSKVTKAQEDVTGVPRQVPPEPFSSKVQEEAGGQPSTTQISRPSQLDVQSSTSNTNLLTIQAPSSTASCSSQKSLGSHAEGSTGPSPADGGGSRAASPFAKIKSSMAQVANLTQAGLSQGISFAVAKVQKSPEPDSAEETQQNELKATFTQCRTRIIQI